MKSNNNSPSVAADALKQETDYLTPAEAARLLLVSPVTIRTWAQKGLLPAETTLGGHRRFRRSDVEQYVRMKDTAPPDVPLRILVVEDDEQISDYLARLLQHMSSTAHIEIARDGFEAGEKMLSCSPDVVFLDLMMPGMNGSTVCRRIKSNPVTAGARVIAMTGFYTEEHVDEILRAGAECCLARPLTEEQVSLALLGTSAV